MIRMLGIKSSILVLGRLIWSRADSVGLRWRGSDERREQSIWPAYEMEGNPRKVGDPLLPGFSLFNVAFGHQRSRDTWTPSCNRSHVRSEKLEMNVHPCSPSMLLFNFLSILPPFVYNPVFFFTLCFVFFNLFTCSLSEFNPIRKMHLYASQSFLSSLLFLHSQCCLTVIY